MYLIPQKNLLNKEGGHQVTQQDPAASKAPNQMAKSALLSPSVSNRLLLSPVGQTISGQKRKTILQLNKSLDCPKEHFHVDRKYLDTINKLTSISKLTINELCHNKQHSVVCHTSWTRYGYQLKPKPTHSAVYIRVNLMSSKKAASHLSSYYTTRKRSGNNNSSGQQNQIRRGEGMLHNVNAVSATTAANVSDQQVIDVIGVSTEERLVKLP